MSFCGNVLELVQKRKIEKEISDFIRWTEFENLEPNDPRVELYIEKQLIPELKQEDVLVIDVAIGELEDGNKMGMLFIKKGDNVYG
ncbi:MAG: hypothetical protein R6U96_04815 [Promethearchaeia archaeon]